MAKDNIIRLNTSRYSTVPSQEEMAIDDIARRLKKLEQEFNKIQRKAETPLPPKAESEKKNILSLRREDPQNSGARRMMKRVSPAPTPLIKNIAQSTLNATARRLLSATCRGIVFITFHSYIIPTMHTLTEELRDEERAGGFSSDDPTDDTFMPVVPLPPISPEPPPAMKPEPVKPVAVKQTIDVAKLREQEIVPPHVPTAVAPELEVQREGLKWVRILVLSGVSIICAMVILAWFLASRNTAPVETKHVVQFSPAEPPSPTVQQPAPTVQQAQPSVKTNDVTSKSSVHRGYATSNQNGFNETTVPDESVLTKRLIDPHYEIQALATPRRTEAEQMVSSLKARGADAFVSATVRNNIDFFRVRIGNYSTERDAKNEAKRLGLNAAWIEKIQ